MLTIGQCQRGSLRGGPIILIFEILVPGSLVLSDKLAAPIKGCPPASPLLDKCIIKRDILKSDIF